MVSFEEVVADIANDGRRSSRTIRKLAQEALNEHEREQERTAAAVVDANATRPIVRNGPAGVATYADGDHEQLTPDELRARGL